MRESAETVWTSPSMDGSYPVRVLEEWSVIDRWWTPEPIHVVYQDVQQGQRRFARRKIGGGEWEEAERL